MLKNIIVLVGLVLLDLYSNDGIGIEAIYNGKNATQNKFLWVAQIRSDSDLLCHGALISDRWVLTIASCVNGGNVQDVVVGDYDRSVVGDGEEVAVVKRVILHPSHSFFHNNIALLELNASVNVDSPSIEPISTLAKPATEIAIEKPRRKCQIAGWGETMQGGSWKLSDILQELKVIKEHDDVCSRIGLTGKEYYYCFKMGKFHSGPCFKDNGAAVVYKVFGKRELVGLMYGQFSVDGCVGGVKIVARASKYKSWIQQYVPEVM